MRVYRFPAWAALLAVVLSATPAAADISNPFSAFPIDANGAYNPGGEWTDITPAWFTSSPVTGATPTFPGDPNANSLLLAGLARDTPASPPELYLMYDYLGRQSAPTTPGEFLGNVSFPINIGGVSTPITIIFNANATLTGADIVVDLHDNGPLHSPAEFGISGAVGPGLTPPIIAGGGSPFTTTIHELIELEVPLNIPAGFGTPGGPFPQQGVGDGHNGYSPLPAFWGSNISKDAGDPPASGALFTINPDGSTLIHPLHIPAPEPSTLVLGALGALGLLVVARKRRRSA